MFLHRTALLALLALASLACGSGVSTGTGGGTSSSTGPGGTGGATTTGSTSSASSSSSTAAGTGGAGTGGGPQTCTWSKTDPCGAGEYCDATACGAGTCVAVGTTETQDRTPVCGCDGVTYWNASVAARHGMAVAQGGACSPGKTCGGFANLQCPSGASCNYHIPDKGTCGGADLGGTCWTVPATCMPGIGFGPNTRACASLSCTDECDLIKLMTPWYVDNTCPQ
jgi:hypothetical protein